MKLTSMQREAIEKCVAWYFDHDKERKYFIIHGKAGVGKTFIVQTLVQVLGLASYNTLFCAYSGKAVSVLRKRGNFANTVHKTFYHTYRRSDGEAAFNKKKGLPNVIKLICIDEYGMLNNQMVNDILEVAGSIPVVMLGDDNQLPPLYGGNDYMENPDVVLTEIMRQNEKSGILTLADMAIEEKPFLIGKYGDSKVVRWDDIDPIESYDAVLCWKNSTREALNRLIRKKLGITHTFPTKGEKILCLNNSYSHELVYDGLNLFIVNGLGCIATTDALSFDDERGTFEIKFKPDFIPSNNYFFHARCNQKIFTNYLRKTPDSEGPHDPGILDIDFGYALTVHKSQGSEWGKILVIASDYGGSKADYKRWLYTAITRARLSVTITNL